MRVRVPAGSFRQNNGVPVENGGGDEKGAKRSGDLEIFERESRRRERQV